MSTEFYDSNFTVDVNCEGALFNFDNLTGSSVADELFLTPRCVDNRVKLFAFLLWIVAFSCVLGWCVYKIWRQVTSSSSTPSLSSHKFVIFVFGSLGALGEIVLHAMFMMAWVHPGRYFIYPINAACLLICMTLLAHTWWGVLESVWHLGGEVESRPPKFSDSLQFWRRLFYTALVFLDLLGGANILINMLVVPYVFFYESNVVVNWSFVIAICLQGLGGFLIGLLMTITGRRLHAISAAKVRSLASMAALSGEMIKAVPSPIDLQIQAFRLRLRNYTWFMTFMLVPLALLCTSPIVMAISGSGQPLYIYFVTCSPASISHRVNTKHLAFSCAVSILHCRARRFLHVGIFTVLQQSQWNPGLSIVFRQLRREL